MEKEELQQFLETTSDLMKTRWKWDRLLGKARNGRQSLMQHSFMGVQFAISLIENELIALSDREQQALLLAIACHDAGKESEEFQEKLRGAKNLVADDTDVKLSVERSKEIAERLDWTFPQKTIEGLVRHHMKHHNKVGEHTVTRINNPELEDWGFLAQLLYDIDKMISAHTPQSGFHSFQRSSYLSQLLSCTYHSIQLRGVSSVQLHRAIQITHQDNSWIPVLHFPMGTIYLTAKNPITILQEHIRAKLGQQLEVIFNDSKIQGRRIHLMHGGITSTYFVKPEIYTLDSLKDLLYKAADGIGNRLGSKINDNNKQQFHNIKQLLLKTGDFELAKKGKETNKSKLLDSIPVEHHSSLIISVKELTSEESMRTAEEVGGAYKEIAILKMFKNIMDTRQGIVTEEAYEFLVEAYDTLFGQGAYAALSKTATLMPGIDAALTVLPYWNQSPKQFGYTESKLTTMGALDEKQRRKILIDSLTKIGEKVYQKLKLSRSLNKVSQDMASVFINDLEFPSPTVNVKDLSMQMLDAYQVSKQNVNKAKEVPHICPLCNKDFEKGFNAIDDIISKPTVFSNRITAYTGQGYQVCPNCYYERILQQLMMGGKVGEFIVVFPTTIISQQRSAELEEMKTNFLGQIYSFAEHENAGDYAISLSMEESLARNLRENSSEKWNTETLGEVFAYKKSEARKAKERKKILEVLQDQWGESVERINFVHQLNYQDWDQFIDDILQDKVDHSIEAVVNTREVVKSEVPVSMIYETPNFILFPTFNPNQSSAIDNQKESKAKSACKRLLISCLFHKVFNMSVAIVDLPELSNTLMENIGGSVYVPDHRLVKKEVLEARKRWMCQHEKAELLQGALWLQSEEGEVDRWIEAIKSAILIYSKVAYPEKNNLYQILSLKSGGELLRRMEMKKNSITPVDWKYIKNIEEVLA